MTAVASLGLKPTNHDDDTYWSGPSPNVAVPVLPAVGHCVCAFVPVPDRTTASRASIVSEATSLGNACCLLDSCRASALPAEPSTDSTTNHGRSRTEADIGPPA